MEPLRRALLKVINIASLTKAADGSKNINIFSKNHSKNPLAMKGETNHKYLDTRKQTAQQKIKPRYFFTLVSVYRVLYRGQNGQDQRAFDGSLYK